MMLPMQADGKRAAERLEEIGRETVVDDLKRLADYDHGWQNSKVDRKFWPTACWPPLWPDEPTFHRRRAIQTS